MPLDDTQYNENTFVVAPSREQMDGEDEFLSGNHSGKSCFVCPSILHDHSPYMCCMDDYIAYVKKIVGVRRNT